MLSYVDRDGEALTREEWAELVRDESYCVLRRARRGRITVEARWLGVASDLEDHPLPFCVSASGERRDGPPEEITTRWAATAREALHEAEQVLCALFPREEPPARKAGKR